MEPINNPDVNNTDPEYWELVLLSHGLSNRKGESPRARIKTEQGTKQINKLLHVGGLNNLVSVDEQQFRKESGRVKPDGSGPDR